MLSLEKQFFHTLAGLSLVIAKEPNLLYECDLKLELGVLTNYHLCLYVEILFCLLWMFPWDIHWNWQSGILLARHLSLSGL